MVPVTFFTLRTLIVSLVRLFKFYNSKCPVDRPSNALYLKPRKTHQDIWYLKSAVGHNTLANMVSKMIKQANIPGNFSNHSLCSTATTRLFHASVDEQLIMARTGHSSTRGVRAYKRICDQQKQYTSSNLNSKKKREYVENKENTDVANIVSTVQLEESSSMNEMKLPFQLNISSSFNVNYNK